MVRKATIEDLEQINDIYNQNVSENSVANCHLTKTTKNYWESSITDDDTIFAVKERADGMLSGWGCIKPFSIREEYRGICELSIYVNLENQNGMVAFYLYKHLIEKAKEGKYRQVAALVLEENIRSFRMLYKDGFVKVLELPEVATKSDKMINLILLCKKLY